MSDDEVHFDADLFTNESYESRHVQVGSHRLNLLCSPSACTDYDLTGQVLWPAASLLASYLAAHPERLTGRSCACELGAGLGLVGLVAAQHCPVVLTDHSEVVLRVLRRNVDANVTDHWAQCMLLDWGDVEGIEAVLAAAPDQQGFDLVLGADVCYSVKALPSLFSTAARLLSPAPGALFLLGYVSRAAGIDRGIHTEAARVGLGIMEIAGTRQSVGGGLEGVVFQLQHCTQ
ncbi:hypothetical protein WJX72_002891 [[Myrmecia] bisecta]|uniref:Uncharacterized protein n=1 Tax=[Myrmecia] bisecta TaxID=41462 RepID=A0AAW1P4T8_9CHLO